MNSPRLCLVLAALGVACGGAPKEGSGSSARRAPPPPVAPARPAPAPAPAPTATPTSDSPQRGEPVFTVPPDPSPHAPPRIVSVAVADAGTCAVDEGGAVYCWGVGAPGSPRRVLLRPERLLGIDDATAVVGGDHRTFCVLRQRHPVTCWGGLEDAPTPHPELRPERPEDLAIGANAVCARGASRVTCVGTNGADRTLPADLTGVEGLWIVHHTQYARTARETICAGLANYNQCLDGTGASTAPRRVSLEGLRRIRGHSATVCGLFDGGEVRCWGEYLNAQTASGFAPEPPRALPALRGALDLAVFQGGGVCGLLPGGRVVCTRVSRSDPGPPTTVVKGGATALVGAERHGCVLREGGALSCWGAESLGLLGNNAAEFVARPFALPDLKDARRLLLLAQTTLVLRSDGTLVEVGRGSAGITRGGVDDVLGFCGDVNVHRVVRAPRGAPLDCAGFESAVQVGMPHTPWLSCGLFPDATVRCKGTANSAYSESQGQGGIAGYAVQDVRVAGATELVMSSGLGGCARLQRGGMSCFGLPSVGPLLFGQPTGEASREINAPSGKPSRSVAWHRDEVCVIDADGAAFCHGSDATTDYEYALRRIEGVPRLQSISAGRNFFCAVAEEGTVHCWGDNIVGQLGAGHNAPQVTPVAALDLRDAVEIASGEYHTCARGRDGRVHCWGANGDGRCGAPAPRRRAEPVPPAW